MIAWFADQPLVVKIVLGGLGSLLILFLLWLLCLRKYLEWQNVRTLDIKERVRLKVEFVKTAAQIVGGLFFILTILVAYRNYQVSQKNLDLAQDKQVTELYVKAIGQLGSDKLPVVLGGIYALERIARNSDKDKGPILEVFCAYVRQNAPWPPEDPAAAQKRRPWTKKGRPGIDQPKKEKADNGVETKPEPDIDVQAILTVIGRLGSVYFVGGIPQRLDLARTDLRGANLGEARLEYTILWGAHLEGAYLEEAHLEEARLWYAHLKGAKLMGAHLVKARLGGAHLEEAYFHGADLRTTDLWKAQLERAYLYGADLHNAAGLTQDQIDAAYCDDKTKLPPGLKCSQTKPSP